MGAAETQQDSLCKARCPKSLYSLRFSDLKSRYGTSVDEPKNPNGAVEKTRTSTGCPTATSRLRVYHSATTARFGAGPVANPAARVKGRGLDAAPLDGLDQPEPPAMKSYTSAARVTLIAILSSLIWISPRATG